MRILAHGALVLVALASFTLGGSRRAEAMQGFIETRQG